MESTAPNIIDGTNEGQHKKGPNQTTGGLNLMNIEMTIKTNQLITRS